MTQPLAQRCERDGSIVPKGTVVETVRRNLAELRARRNDEHGLSRGVKHPIEPGPTVGAKEAAHHQADANAASGCPWHVLVCLGHARNRLEPATLITGSVTLSKGTTMMMSTKTIMMTPGTTKRPGASFQLRLQQKLVTPSLPRHHHIFFASEVLRPRRRSMSTIRLLTLTTIPTPLPTSALIPLPTTVLFSPKTVPILLPTQWWLMP